MDWKSLLKALPSLVTLVGRLFGSAKTPPKKAEDILGDASTKTESEMGWEELEERAKEKFGGQ